MLGRLFGGRSDRDPIAADLYGAIVAWARRPQFYAEYGVPDTVAGRFEMVLLHMTIFMDRLEAGSQEEHGLGQQVFDVFCNDMDETLREFGVGDAVMGKRMKKVAQSYYGRSKAYRAAFAAGSDDDLLQVLQRNLFPGEERVLDPRLAYYIGETRAEIAKVPADTLTTGAAPISIDDGPNRENGDAA